MELLRFFRVLDEYKIYPNHYNSVRHSDLKHSMTQRSHIDQVQELFDTTAQSWHDRYVDFSRANDLVLWDRKRITTEHILATVSPGGKILDAGCGAGNLAIELAELGYSVHGIDIAPSMIQLCNKKLSRLSGNNLTCSFSTATLSEIGKAQEAQYDCVVGLGLIEYQDDDRMGIPDLASTLKPGGRLILTGPQRFSLSRGIGLVNLGLKAHQCVLQLTGHNNSGQNESIHKFTVRSLTKMVNALGFEQEKYWQHGYASFPLISRLLSLKAEMKINELLSAAQRIGHLGFLANNLIVSFRKLS